MTGEAMSLDAEGTPGSFINGRFLSGAQPYEAFKKLADEELAKAKGKDGAPRQSKTNDSNPRARPGRARRAGWCNPA